MPVVDATNTFEATLGTRTDSIRSDIQGLRAIAVTLVVLYHANFPGLGGGFMGVDVFFVISGFVITGQLLRHTNGSISSSLTWFYSRRIRRIVPAATVVLVATVTVGYAILQSSFDPSNLADARWASLFAANFHFINTNSGYSIPGVAPSLVQHFWSLAVEEQFYFVWPLILILATRWTTRNRRRTFLVVTLAVLIVISAIWSIYQTGSDQVAAYYSPFTRGWEIGLGALLALVPVRWSQLTESTARWLSYAGISALALAVLVLRTPTNFPGVVAWWPCLATAVLIFAGSAAPNVAAARWTSTRGLVALGNRSYSLYLWHFAWLEIPLLLPTPWTGWLSKVLEITGAMICAQLSHRYIERPVKRSRRLNHDAAAVALLLFVSVALVWDATLLVGNVMGAR